MSEDKPNDWRDKFKSPTKNNERMIGDGNNLPKNEDGQIDRKKFIEEGKDRQIKPQEFDKELWEKKQAKREYPVTEPVEEKKKAPVKKSKTASNLKQLASKVDELMSHSGKGRKSLAFRRRL